MKIVLTCALLTSLVLTFFLPHEFGAAFADSYKIFVIYIDGQSYVVRYNITNGVFTDSKSDKEQKTILIEIRPSAAGILSVQLPRIIIDSSGETSGDGSKDVPYVITLYEKSATGSNMTETRIVAANETFTNDSFRNLDIDFSEDTYMIAITGTYLVPEFGSVAILAATVSVIGVVSASRFLKFL